MMHPNLVARRSRTYFLALCIVLLVAPSLFAQRLPLRRTRRYATDHVIVKFKKSAQRSDVRRLQARVRGTPLRTLRSSGAVLLKLGRGQDVDDVIARLQKDPNVVYAERDHYLKIHATIPNDPDFASCWGLHNEGQMLGEEDADIDAPEAWDVVTGSSTVIVGVVDTGVDYDHVDLAANMWINPGETPGNGVDDDGNGYVDDVHGISMLSGVGSGDPDDDHGHGTHVAGILGAVGNNSTGIVGVNWTVSIMALKFLNSAGYGLESDAATCIDYAVAHGAKILNNSYGGPDYSATLLAAIQAANAAGVLFCTSAGNDSMDTDLVPTYPGCYDVPNIITITSTSGSDGISYFSNYGVTTVDVGAPGEAIWSTVPNDDYQLLDGTSMSCPFVSGIAALVLAHEPTLTLTELRDRVMWTGDRLFDLQELTTTGLRVNAYNAVMGIYSVHIDTLSPLPDAKVGDLYSTTLEATGFAPPYTWSWGEPTYVEREVSCNFTWDGTPKGWQADNDVWNLPLGFSFPYYGETYTNVWVCSNGFIEFADTEPYPTDISDVTTLKQRKIIAVYWTDLDTSSILGDKDIFVWYPDASSIGIRWQAREAIWLFGMPINCSVVLHSDGRIEMHYGPDNMSLVGGLVALSKGNNADYRISVLKTNRLDIGWAPSSLWIPGETPPGLDLTAATGEIHGTPTTAGTYDFDATVHDASGGSHTRQFQIKVFSADGPMAEFEGTPILKGIAPHTVNFNDLSTSTALGGITAWSWNFGDTHASTLQNPSRTYTAQGIYTVALTVTDANGSDTMTKIRYVEVFRPGPIVDFQGTPTTGEAPLTVTFEDLSEEGDHFDSDFMIWTWDYGDGTGDTWYWSLLPWTYPFHDHVYENPGIYDVTLEIMDWSIGQGIKWKQAYITVTGGGPVLGVSVTPDTFGFGFLEPGVVVTNAGTPLEVQNTGEVAEDIGIRIRVQDNWNEWTAGTPGVNVYRLRTRLESAMGSFTSQDTLTTTVQWCDGAKFGGGGDAMPVDGTVNQWFQFSAPTGTTGVHAGDEHTITVEISCRQAE